MKRYFRTTVIIIFLTMILSSCNTETPISVNHLTGSYIPSDSAKMQFLPDAMDFAVQYLFEIKSPDTSMILPPDSILNIFLFPLARLYDDRHEIPLLDTLIVQDNVHKYPNASISIYLLVDTSYLWVKNVLNGISPTGNTVVDSLVKLYNIHFGWWLVPQRNVNPVLIPTLPNALNNYALGRAFRSIAGVTSTDINYWYLNSPTLLNLVPNSTVDTVRLYVGYGDCPSGCMGYNCWTFLVNMEYDVTYTGHTRQ